MTILITGVGGCIGQTLATRLLAQGHEIVGTDLSSIGNTLDITIEACDITNNQQVNRVVERIKPEYIVHCAGIMEGETDDLLQQVNVEGTRHICEAASQYQVKRLVHLSSVAVVSGHTTMPLTDDMSYHAINAYGESKIAAEKLVLAWREKQLPSAILRPAIVYGEREHRVLDPFLTAIQNRKLPILDIDEMDAKLQLVYAENVALALELALFAESAVQGTSLIADPEPITLRRLFEIGYEALDVKPVIVKRWLSQRLMQKPEIRNKLMEMFRHAYYDLSNAERYLNYQPEYRTEVSLKQTICLWKNNQYLKGE